MTNAPTADWYFVEVKRHINSGNFYEVQTAHAMTGANVGIIYERVQQSASAGTGWGAWVAQGAVTPGTLCGTALYTQWGGLVSTTKCNGVTPPSCPVGYIFTMVENQLVANYGGGAFQGATLYACLKN